jgi:hypothetical protein
MRQKCVTATTQDIIEITLPDGSVVSATGEAWVKWLTCGEALLEACKAALENLKDRNAEDGETGDALRAAIAKATGDHTAGPKPNL